MEGRGQTGGTEGQEEDKGSAEAAGAAGSTTITITTSTAVAMRLHGHQQPPTATTFPWSPTRDTCPCPYPVPPGRGGPPRRCHHHGHHCHGCHHHECHPHRCHHGRTRDSSADTADHGQRSQRVAVVAWGGDHVTAAPAASNPAPMGRGSGDIPRGLCPLLGRSVSPGWPVTLQPCPSTHRVH